jgi:hypothetical protein
MSDRYESYAYFDLLRIMQDSVAICPIDHYIKEVGCKLA